MKTEKIYMTALGVFNDDNINLVVNYVPNSQILWDLNERLLFVGNGHSETAHSNALAMRKSGKSEFNFEVIAPNFKVKAPAGGISMGDFGAEPHAE